ncbi:smad nuclear-interacting protein 1-like [Teleopsis dalmanni]|uniref:smad nuclear-interacting protein 1-like n=1 Tax=Teleopsis dalmanni TaxID=139649 RepID=UPI0018CD2363|nr:smad nuclear-interacting protein 1-like [Teleopsis dalmanni]
MSCRSSSYQSNLSSNSSSYQSDLSSNSSYKEYRRKKRSYRNRDRSSSRDSYESENRCNRAKCYDIRSSRRIEQENNRERHQSTEQKRDSEKYQHKSKGSNDRSDYRRNNDNNLMNEKRKRSRSRAPLREQNTEQYSSKNEKKHKRYNRDNDDESYEWGKKLNNNNTDESSTKPIEKEKPNFGLSGALTEDANKVNGTVVKYAEPPEARKPKRMWRLYPFKGEKALPILHIHRQSCFLVGRDRNVGDLILDHPSCSKQHAALQYRLVQYEREDGTKGKRVRPYLIDLESANGTFLNNKKIESRKYYELMEKDVIKFGFSTREYVLLHENSKDQEGDDDIKQESDNKNE